MTFGEKLKKLRTGKGITQEELASKIYVTRTAVSKWESERGYPNIDSLKALAKFFSITVDELLSSDEILTIAEESQKRTEKRLHDLIFGLLDACMSLLLFLPLLAAKGEGAVKGASALTLDGVALYLKISYLALVLIMSAFGILTFVLQGQENAHWMKIKTKISLFLGIVAVLLFAISHQPYATVFVFSLLIIKAVIVLKRS